VRESSWIENNFNKVFDEFLDCLVTDF
jgi:hypothetical protein